ncbi:MAG: GtrA family protein [Clostridia bacterium]|nr:GtrA family protein [Clostridia bacterium]
MTKTRILPIQKTIAFLRAHPREYEMIRYIIAGGLTTLLSLAVSSLYCILVSADHTVDGATVAQLNVGKGLSWVIAVLFAFWVNRRMVFLRRGGTAGLIMKELAQFAFSRAVSGLAFEFGLLNLLALLGVGNLLNMLIVLVFVTVANYVVSKFWIFSRKEQKEDQRD